VTDSSNNLEAFPTHEGYNQGSAPGAIDDLYQRYRGHTMPPKTVAGLLLCRIVIICLIGAIAIVTMVIACPHDNNKEAITILLGFLSASIVGLLSLAKNQENAYMMREHAEQVQSSLERLNIVTKDAAHKADVAASKAGEAAARTSQTLSTIQKQTDSI
jgi:hypothetical protein